MGVRILDLYCGMGGLSLGLALALEGAEILGLDIDRWVVETYNLNLSRLNCRARVQDVLSWGPEGDFDVVAGGSPCQPFSLANTKKRGEDHELFPTFPRFFDVVLALRPRAFLLENVKGLTLRPFRHYLEAQLRRVEGDYRVWAEVLDASRHGVPQRRERLFVVGLRRDVGARFEFPSPTHAPSGYVGLDGRRIHRWLTLREAVGDLMALPPAEGKKLVQTNPRHGKPADLDRPSRVIKVDGRGGDFCDDTILIPLSPEQAGRIMRERSDTSRHWGRMAFPDSLEAPCRTLSSHTVEGTKRETIVLPFVDSEGRSVALPPDHVSGSGRPMTERQLERYRRRWRERGLEARGGMLFMDSRGEVVEIPWTPYQDVYPPLRPDAPSRTLYSHVAKWSRDMLVAVPFMDSKGEVVGLPWTEFQSKHPPLRPDEPSVAVVSHSAKSSRHLLAPALAEHVTTPLDPSRWWVGNEWGSRVMREGAPAFTITEKHRSGQLLPVVYRRLTVRECLRVQSFPDWWRFPEGCAVSRRYKLVGEAVPPILAYRLGVALAKALGLRAREPPREGDWALPYFRRAFADYFSG